MPKRRPYNIPTTTAKLGRDTVRMLRAVADKISWHDGRHDATLDDAVWVLADAAGMTSGKAARSLVGIPLDRTVYRTAPAENGIPEGTSRRSRGR